MDILEVRLYAKRAGTLTRLGTSLLGFTYDAGYARARGNAPLSACLPLDRAAQRPKRVTAWFEGLLPEGARRSHLARIVGTAEIDAWTLLAAAGGECAGAVQIVDPAYRDEPGWLALDDHALARLLREVPIDPIAQVSAKARISVAGAQDKVALTRTADGTWSVPVSGAPSTHLLKPASRRFPGLVENEHWCMTVSREAGVETATTHIETIGGSQVLVVARYDRRATTAGTIERIHQEDTAQALGRAAKYQDEGGPTLHEIGAIAGIDPSALLERVALSWMLGNGDAHAKNYSVLEPATPQARLAPVYDMVQTECYFTRSALAIGIGRAKTPGEVKRADIETAARRLGLAPGEGIERLRALAARVLDATDRVERDSLPRGSVNVATVKARAGWALDGFDEAKRPARGA